MQITKTILSLLLSGLFFTLSSTKVFAQPLMQTTIHSKLGKLNNCIHFIPKKKLNVSDQRITIHQLFDVLTLSQTQVDHLIKQKNYTLDSLEITTDTLGKRTTNIRSFYVHNGKINKTLEVRKVCMGTFTDPMKAKNCAEGAKFNWTRPITLKSYESSEYNLYKSAFLKDFSAFKLVNCELRNTYKAKYQLVEEVYKSPKHEVTFRIFCKKVKEEPDGFHCKQGYYFEIEIGYNPAYFQTEN